MWRRRFSRKPNVLATNGYLVIITAGSTSATPAVLTTQHLTYEAVTPGVAGNSINITYVSGGTKGAEAVTVAGNDIEVEIEDGASIAAEIKQAIDDSVAAAALVTVSLEAGHETDTQDAATVLSLAGGTAAGATETYNAMIARTLNSVYYFGILLTEVLGESDLVSLSTYVQTLDKVLFYASRTQADYAPGGMLDDLRTASKTHTRGLYYYGTNAIDTQCYAASYAGRALSTNFDGVNTAQTMHLKSLAGVAIDATVDQTNLVAAGTAGVDVYVSIAGVPCLFTSGGNSYFDQVYNQLWFKAALQTAMFNYLRQTNTKIPQTEEGMEGMKGVVRGVCAQAVLNGFAGRGAWSSATVFGNPADLIRNVADCGYYVYSLPVADQLQAAREARQAPVVQVALKEAGAIHSASVIVNINR
jgi:hypothetical protein